jgi:hypothetical protein
VSFTGVSSTSWGKAYFYKSADSLGTTVTVTRASLLPAPAPGLRMYVSSYEDCSSAFEKSPKLFSSEAVFNPSGVKKKSYLSVIYILI